MTPTNFKNFFEVFNEILKIKYKNIDLNPTYFIDELYILLISFLFYFFQ